MEGSPLKILVCGSINGKIGRFFKRISSIQNKNGPFEMVLCCGQFFAVDGSSSNEYQQLVKGEIKAPLPVFVLGPTSDGEMDCYAGVSEDDGGEISDSVTYLGKRGVFNTASGLQIAYLGGRTEGEHAKSRKYTFCRKDVDELVGRVSSEEKFRGVDLLLTSCWPKGVTRYVKTEIEEENPSELVTMLTTRLKPRYHFSSHKEYFMERPPYRNHKVLVDEQQHITRFISLAPFGNTSNKKYLYAFSITPLCHMKRDELIKQTDDTTEFPYKAIINSMESRSCTEDGKPKSFFFDDHASESRKRPHGDNHTKGEKRTPKGPPVFTGPCWFCLGSKEVEKHLIISVGELSYLALAKGALTPYHVLICPISHYNSTVLLPDDALMEIERYKRALRKMFKKMDHSCVIFERNFYTQHLQVQVMPFPKSVDANVSDLFTISAQNQGMEMIEIPDDKDLKDMVATTTPYFTVEFDSGLRLLHRVKNKMPLHFGREVVACSLLDMPDRVNWKSCKQSKDEETLTTKKFRQLFKPFDFNIV